MAYCRFAHDSDAYIFEDTRGGLTCCGCRLGGRTTDFNCALRTEMLAHMDEHRKEGHRIPDDAIEELRADLAAEGDVATNSD